MIVETRKTAAGTEYWDAKEKRTRFVPVGNEPGFEVTVKPKSMIMGVDLAKDPDKTAIDGQLIDDEIELNHMTVPQLKKFAADNNIVLPKELKKKEDIIEFIADAE
jgi:hypothetical protein